MFVKRNAAVWLLSLSITSQAAGMNAPLEKKNAVRLSSHHNVIFNDLEQIQVRFIHDQANI